jgi:hypothetical protein
MTRWEKVKCPVCLKLVAASDIRSLLHAHTDKAGHPCPMSGQVAC